MLTKINLSINWKTLISWCDVGLATNKDDDSIGGNYVPECNPHFTHCFNFKDGNNNEQQVE